MATKLKKMQLTSVDLVRAGANQEADIRLFKSEDPQEDHRDGIIKRFMRWLRHDDAATHDESPHIEKGHPLQALEAVYKTAIAESIASIEGDSTLTDGEKSHMIEKSIDQYNAKMNELQAARYDEIVEIGKASNYDVIVEVEKFNPYHDRLGRFASAGSAASFTFQTKDPKKQHMADAAAAREKERTGAAAGAAAGAGAATASSDGEKKPKSVENTEIQSGHREGVGTTGAEMVRAVQEDARVGEKTAKVMVKAVNDYSGDMYEEIRAAQKAGEPHAHVKAIETFIERSPKWDGGDLHRGLYMKNPEDAVAFAKGLKKGTVFSDGALSSWSSSLGVAEGFAATGSAGGHVVLRLIGGTMNGTSIKHLSSLKYENEVLLSGRANFKVQSVKKKKIANGADITYYIDVVEAV